MTRRFSRGRRAGETKRTTAADGARHTRARPWATALLTVALLTAAALASALVPTALRAQVPTLDRVDSLIAHGQYPTARATLDGWFSARDQFDVPGSDMARALMLRARLAPDPGAAEPDYLAIVLGYPTSEHAAEALLRLGQGLLAAGDAGRAAAYLERLVSDYPGRPQRTPGLLWLARARSATRRYEEACSAAREGLRDGRDPDLTAMLRVEAGASCGVAAGEPARPAERSAPAPTPQARPGPVAGESADGAFAVQAGAFRYRESATALMERLRAAGFESRLVRVPANQLLRVRIGRFQDHAAASRLVERLKAGGFDALVVSNVREETEP